MVASFMCDGTQQNAKFLKSCLLYFDKIEVMMPSIADKRNEANQYPIFNIEPLAGALKLDKDILSLTSLPVSEQDLPLPIIQTTHDILKQHGVIKSDLLNAAGSWKDVKHNKISKYPYLDYDVVRSFLLESLSRDTGNQFEEIIASDYEGRLYTQWVPSSAFLLSSYMVALLKCSRNVINTNRAAAYMVQSEFDYKRESFDGILTSSSNNDLINHSMAFFIKGLEDMEFEHIFEIKQTCSQELNDMRHRIRKINLGSNEMDFGNVKYAVEAELQPQMDAFRSKLKLVLPRTALDAIDQGKKLAIFPFLGWFFPIPTAVGAAISLSTLSIETIIKNRVKNIELSSDPLYFTMSLDKKLDTIARKYSKK